MSESVFQLKLANMIRIEISEILAFELKYIPGAMVTVSLVRVTGDLGIAKVYVTVLPDGKLQETVDALNEHAWEVRRSLAGRIRNKVKKIPELRFYQDDSFPTATRIDELLDQE